MLACHARANGSIPLCCTMKKFTQEELEAAYEQMQRERADDAHAANSAAHWVNDQLHLVLSDIKIPDVTWGFIQEELRLRKLNTSSYVCMKHMDPIWKIGKRS
jgi:hypothetical protein